MAAVSTALYNRRVLEILGIPVHLYGLIVGTAAVVGIELAIRRAKLAGLNADQLWSSVWPVLVGGLIGARAWHVVTDWPLYQTQPLNALAFWQGGLSVLGAMLGGAIGLWAYSRLARSPIKLAMLLDLSVFGLPAAQAIGRWGNFVNQELYGLPSSLPWAITIDPQFRLPGFEGQSTYHPLFAYELLLTGAFGGWLWWHDRRHQLQRQRPLAVTHQLIGTGSYALLYGWYYSGVRLLLDFIRIDKTASIIPSLGTNQVVLVIIWVVLGWWLYQRRQTVALIFKT